MLAIGDATLVTCYLEGMKMSDEKKINDSKNEKGMSRRVALQRLGLGAAAFTLPMITTVSDAQAAQHTHPDPDPHPDPGKSKKSHKSTKSHKSKKSRKSKKSHKSNKSKK